MKNSFTFVHAADLHLDTPFKGATIDDPSVIDALRVATFDAYRRLVDLCIERQAAFLLIAGDVYDGEDRSLRAQLRFRDGLIRLAERNIQVFVAHGNHDYSGCQASAIHWPGNVHIFGHHEVESTMARVNGLPIATIHGISHGRKNESENLARRFQVSPGELLKIGLLHCNVGLNTGHEAYAPCELPDLLDKDIDYWALGHVHERRTLDSAPYIIYSGNTQGRHFRETGARGCMVVSVEDGRIGDVEFCSTDSVRWSEGSVRIEELGTLDELERFMVASVQGLAKDVEGRGLVCRLSVQGRGRLYPELRKISCVPDLLDRLRETFRGEEPFVWVNELMIDCRPEIDMERRRDAGDFLAQVLSVSRELALSPDRAEALTRTALSDLIGHRQFERSVGGFSDSELSRMRAEAELICLDGLEGEG
jgi:exonuclease SbcD